MKILRRFIRKFALIIYAIGKNAEKKTIEDTRQKKLNSSATFDDTVYFYPEASIHNGLNDKKMIRIGKQGRIQGELILFGHGGEIIIGNHVFIGKDSRIWSAKKISIGNRVLIAHNVNIHDNNSHPLNSELRHQDFLHIFSKGLQKVNDLREEEILIEDDVWIGFNCTILKGVKIGRGAIVGANSVITADVQPYSVIVGNPPRIIKTTD